MTPRSLEGRLWIPYYPAANVAVFANGNRECLIDDELNSGEKMPGWNLVDARSLLFKNYLRWSLTASLAVMTMAAIGCTKFSPGSLQEIFNSQPDAWHSEPAAPADFYLAPDAQEALDSLHGSKNPEGKAKASIVLPEIDPAEIAAMNDGNFDINPGDGEFEPVSTTSTDQTNGEANLVVDELVPAPEVFGQPLRPLTFDHQSRKRIDDEVGSLRQENIIRLTAEPSEESVQTPNPVAELVEPPKIVNNREPSLPPLEIVDARYLPNSKNRVELPQLPLGDAQKVKSKDWNSQIEHQFESAGGHVLRPIVQSEESSSANQAPSQIAERIPPFADHPEMEVSQSSLETHQAKEFQPDEHAANDFELPMSQEPPKINLESTEGDDFNPGPIKRIDSHADREQPCAEFAGPFRALTLRGAVVGSATAFAAPVATEPVVADEPLPTNELAPSSTKPTDTKLRLVNANFCSTVSGYGQFDAFEQNRFGPNQHLLVYCEIENFVSVEDIANDETKFKTTLRGSYQILAADGSTIDMYEFPIVEDIARNQRRDFYVHLPVHLGNLPTGTYSIQLNIDDLNGNSSANLTNPIEFDVIQ